MTSGNRRGQSHVTISLGQLDCIMQYGQVLFPAGVTGSLEGASIRFVRSPALPTSMSISNPLHNLFCVQLLELWTSVQEVVFVLAMGTVRLRSG